MTYLLSFLAFWLACGFVAAGWEYAYFQTEYQFSSPADQAKFRALDRRHSWAWMLGGVIALSVGLELNSRRHGWRKWW